MKSTTRKAQEVVKYYSRLGSRLGYRLIMKKSQHFGIYDSTHSTERTAQENFSHQFGQILQTEKGMRVLDVGCGQGVLAVYLAKQQRVHVTGITIVPLEVKKSQKLARASDVSALTNFVVGDYHSLPFPDNTFDRVYVVEALSHAYDLEKVTREVYRVLKPGGMFIAAEYEFDFKDSDYAATATTIARYVKANASIHAIDDFGKGNFLQILKSVGFTVLHEYDWTDRLMKSFRRLKTIGKPFKAVVGLLGREAKHPNAVSSSFYADASEVGVFWYKVYVTRKRKD